MKRELVLLVFVFLVGVVSAGYSNGMVSYWGFDNNFADMIGSNDGTNYGGIFVGGQVRSAVSFDGSSYVDVGSSGIWNLSGDFSVEAWINSNAVGTEMDIYVESNTGDDNPFARMVISGGNLYYGFRNDDALSEISNSIPGIVAGSWQHVALTRSGSTFTLYLDGVGTSFTDTMPSPITINTVNIGVMMRPSPVGYFDGEVDDVSVYDRALSQGEINEIYQRGLSGKGLYECNSSDDVIMKLFSSDNSHGALWNDANYFYDVCYSDFFGGVYGGGSSTVHDCFGGTVPDNKVVGLYDTTNAHAEEPSLDNYGTDVCYGGLSCVVRDSCNAGESVVVSLYNDTNSHLAGGNFSGYGRKICCVSSTVLEWRDMMGNVISSADIGDTVRMVKTNVASGVFEIWENNFVFDNDIRTTDLGNEIVGSIGSGGVYGDWLITQEDLDRAGGDTDEFYFRVDRGSNRSEYFSVSTTEADDDMNVTVVSPSCGESFDEGDIVSVNVTATDGDDLITGNVTVDGMIVDFSNGGVSFDYSPSPGNHQIAVSAVNSRGKKSREIASVMVLDMEGASYVDGDYVAACIDSPEDFSNIEGSYVNFDASGTRGVRVSGGTPSDVLPGSSSLNFYWNFIPQGRSYGKKYAGTGNSLAYKFGTVFEKAGDNSVVLRVELE